MVLCPNHHDQATKNAMSEEEQRRHKVEPHNMMRGYADGLLTVNQSHCALDVGGGTLLVGDYPWIELHGETVLELRSSSEGQLLVTLALYDDEDNLTLEIVDNEWIAGEGAWDIESDWQRLTLRLAPRNVVLRLDARQLPMTLRGVLRRGTEWVRFSGRSDVHEEQVICGSRPCADGSETYYQP